MGHPRVKGSRSSHRRFGKKPNHQPRKFQSRAKSIAAIRLIAEDEHPRGGPFATWSMFPRHGRNWSVEEV